MPRGGKRTGAGRPKGSGKFKEETTAMRVPSSEVDRILSHVQNKFYQLPLYQFAVSAGYPSPAEDDVEERLDLNELLIKRPAATFFLRVSGSSMIKAGIHHNDILVVDRSLEAADGKIVVAALNGELTVKRLRRDGGKIWLVPENSVYKPIEVTGEADLIIWGVVTSVIHSV